MATGDEHRLDLVFQGGGVKGIALAGAIAELDARGYHPACVAGTSAGAITAALVAAGYSGAEIEQIVEHEMNFKSFEDPPRFHELGPFGDAIDIVKRRGIHSGAYFLGWIREKLATRGVTTFGDLKDPAATEERRRYRLQVIASDVSTRTMLVLPRDAYRLGVDPDRLAVADAVRMSMSIPIFFEPVIHENRRTGGRHLIVDGGLLSNFPVWLFDVTDRTPAFPTFGLELVAPGQSAADVGVDPAAPAQLPGFVTYLRSLADTALQAHDRYALEDADYARTISISTLGVGTTDFGISGARTTALVASGRAAVQGFLETWSFERWLATYRRPPGAAPASA